MLLRDCGEGERATALLDAAIPQLTAMRDDAHVDVWDETLFRTGQAMRQ